ncbi:MAG TPA: 5-oxoprolinase subunit PxpA [Candidatus Sulfotelmatobacter sp.]|nr:5-oxoprolinase subunit PxpA [Candidatus Sulfotelmatobacter sp.]
MKFIDINCDVGEMPGAIADGSQEALMPYITSVNIACGGHAGNAQMMRATIEQALRHKLSIGAHPGYEDPTNFGRVELQLSLQEIAASVERQIQALQSIAAECGAFLHHVKAHGALYNQAARDRQIARAIAEGVRRASPNAILVGLAGSVMLDEFRAAGFSAAAEAFADRRYEPDGTLRSRKFADALLCDPEHAAAQALRIVQDSTVIAADSTCIPLHADTLCLHGDTPGARQIAACIHRSLTEAGMAIRPLS